MRLPRAAVPGLAACLLSLSSVVPADSAESVHVRAIDPESRAVLVEQPLTLETPLAIELDGEQRYLALRSARFRGEDALEMSLSARSDEWQSVGYTAWHLPSRQRLGDLLVLQLEPEGWAERFCDEANDWSASEMRDAELSLQVDGQARFLSQPGWDGSSHVSLLELGGDGQPSGWSVQVDEGQLVLIGRELSDPLLIDDLRADFPVFRQFEADGRALKVHFQPAAYPREFCRAWSREGDEYAERVAAYLFDHRPD